VFVWNCPAFFEIDGGALERPKVPDTEAPFPSRIRRASADNAAEGISPARKGDLNLLHEDKPQICMSLNHKVLRADVNDFSLHILPHNP